MFNPTSELEFIPENDFHFTERMGWDQEDEAWFFMMDSPQGRLFLPSWYDQVAELPADPEGDRYDWERIGY